MKTIPENKEKQMARTKKKENTLITMTHTDRHYMFRHKYDVSNAT